jgi:hypothetical protein
MHTKSHLDPKCMLQLPRIFGKHATVSEIQIPKEVVPPIKGFSNHAKKTVTISKDDLPTYAWCYSLPGSTLQH